MRGIDRSGVQRIMDYRNGAEKNGSMPRNDERAFWVKPELKRLDAGAAENTSGMSSDGDFTFS
jgi:hypothetical protein